MDFFDEFNCKSAGEILSRIGLKKALDERSYVCPVCGHGNNGDGIKPRTNDKGQTRWKCHGKCGTNFSNFDLAGAVLGLNPEYDKAELTRQLKELFGIDDDKQSARSDKKFSGSVKTMTNEQAKVEPKNFAKLYDVCSGNRDKFLAERGGSYRAITAATFAKYGVEVHNDFEFQTKDGDKVKTPALIIPYVKGTKVDNGHFVARSISDKVKAFSQHGQAAPLYEPLPIAVANTVNFVVESELDALSIAQVFDGYNCIGCVATGGVAGWRKGVAEIVKRFGDDERKPKFICAFDNDDAGIVNGQAMTSELRSAGFLTEIFFFEGAKAGTVVTNSAGEVAATIAKVDANDLLQRGGGALAERLFEAIEVTGEKFESQAAEIQTEANEPSSSLLKSTAETSATLKTERASTIDNAGIKSHSISEYFKEKFLLDVARTEQYAERKTGFENLDEKLTFVPGLYLLGGLPAAGKTTFAWQLLNQLAVAGEYCIYCSYEMSELELFTKSLSRELFKQKRAGRDVLAPTSFDIRSGRAKSVVDVIQAVETFSFSKAQLHVAELSNTSVTELFAWLKPRINSSPKSPIVVIDYLQILPAAQEDKRGAVDDTLRRLKDFQRVTDATFIVISSFNRQSYWDSVSLESFKESGGIEYSSDCVLGLEAFVPEDKESERKKTLKAVARQDERTIKLVCLKNRNGGAFDVTFRYYAKYDYFEPCKEGVKRREYNH